MAHLDAPYRFTTAASSKGSVEQHNSALATFDRFFLAGIYASNSYNPASKTIPIRIINLLNYLNGKCPDLGQQ